MPTTQLETQIRACIDAFVEDLSTLVKQAAIESVQDALGGSPTTRTSRRPAASPQSRGGKRVRRSTEDVETTAAAVLAYVRSNPGLGVIEIGDALGLTPKQLRLPVKKLLEDRKVRTTGQRRGTKYHAGAPRKTAKSAGKKKTSGKRRKTRAGSKAA